MYILMDFEDFITIKNHGTIILHFYFKNVKSL